MKTTSKIYLTIILSFMILMSVILYTFWINIDNISDSFYDEELGVQTGGGDWTNVRQLRFFDTINNIKTIRTGQPTAIASPTGSLPNSATLSGSNNHILLTLDGQLYVWGRNQYGQLGLNDTNDVPMPTQIDLNTLVPILASDDQVIDVQMGSDHTLLLTKNGLVYSAGKREGLGRSASTYSPTFTKVEINPSYRVIEIGAGKDFSAVIASPLTSGNNVIFTWGINDYGQIGNGTSNLVTYYTTTPYLISTLTSHNPIQLAVGYNSVAILTRTTSGPLASNVYLWGSNRMSQLGLGNNYYSTPTAINGVSGTSLNQIRNIFLNHNSTIIDAIGGGGIYAMGLNATYQLSNRGTDVINTTNNLSQEFSQTLTGNNGIYLEDLQSSDINSVWLLSTGELFIRGSSAEWALGIPPKTNHSSQLFHSNNLYGGSQSGTVNYPVVDSSVIIPNLPLNIAGFSLGGNSLIIWTTTGVIYTAGSRVNYSMGDGFNTGNTGTGVGENAGYDRRGFQALDLFFYQIVRVSSRMWLDPINLLQRYQPIVIPGTAIRTGWADGEWVENIVAANDGDTILDSPIVVPLWLVNWHDPSQILVNYNEFEWNEYHTPAVSLLEIPYITNRSQIRGNVYPNHFLMPHAHIDVMVRRVVVRLPMMPSS